MIRFYPLSLLARCVMLACCVLAVLGSVTPRVLGQSASATLSGVIVDQNGDSIPDVNVTVTNTATRQKRQATTDNQGYFTVPLLPPATYMVNAQRDGFAPVEITDVVLNVGDLKGLQIQLKAGEVSATVAVTNEAPLVKQSTEVSTVIDRQFVANLPLNGRSFQSLITLTPGVVLTKTNFGSQGQFSVNGQRADANYFSVDGVSANFGVSTGAGLNQTAGGAIPALSSAGGTNNLVSVDALQEFKIQTSTYAPEFGRSPGAQVAIVTRGGTNEFRSTVFEYFRNDALDAADWFVNANRQAKPALRQNLFGGVFGGPLIKDRTFFFFSYEGLRLRLPQFKTVDVPSLAARQSAPSQLRPFLDAYPIPNGPVNTITNFAQFSSGYSDPSTSDATSIRVDHTINSKLTVFGRYNYAPSEALTRAVATINNLNNVTSTAIKTQTLTAGVTWIVTPNINNDFRANWSKATAVSIFSIDDFGGAKAPPDAVLFPTPYSSEDALFVLNLVGGRNSNYSVGRNVINLQRQVNLIDSLSIVSGAHQLKFGVDYRRLSPFSGPRKFTEAAVFVGANSFQSGKATLASIQANDPIGLLLNNFSTYAQDTWKTTRRLNLTFGLRWEINPPPKGDGKDLVPLRGLDSPATIALDTPGKPLYSTTYNNFAPRIGFAYQLGQRQSLDTVFRGGFGVFYDLGTQTTGNVVFTFPYVRSRILFGPSIPIDPASATPPAFTLNPPVVSMSAFDPELKLPLTYQWNLAIEQSLGSTQVFSVSYVAAAGRRLLRQDSLAAPNPNFQTVNITRSDGTSDYHALQLQFQRRMTRGLQALASYTWSHSIDSASNDGLNFDSARGPSDFDVRHSFTSALSYNLPFPRLGPVGTALLRDWSIDGIATARSATPVNLIAQTSIINGAQRDSRPDLIQGTPLYIDDPLSPGGKRFNKAAFAHPPADRQGTLGRNALRGFPAWQIDLAVRRQFNFTERFNLQFRAEFFNLLNHPNFADPVNTLTSASFGRSTQMLGRSLGTGGVGGGLNPLYQIGGPRSIQLGLKLNF